MNLPTFGYVIAWRITSIFENLRQVLSPKPSASATVTSPLPSWQEVAFQQAYALSSCAWVSGTVAFSSASFMRGGSESAVMVSVCSAALTVACRSAADTGAPEEDDEEPELGSVVVPPPLLLPPHAVRSRAVAVDPTTAAVSRRCRRVLWAGCDMWIGPSSLTTWDVRTHLRHGNGVLGEVDRCRRPTSPEE